jgi:FkbM family methyltransferase
MKFFLSAPDYTKYVSQHGQDKCLDAMLNRMKNGVFVDVGAYDGLRISNTYFFEKVRDWRGLCIEADPVIFQKLKRNRSCGCLNAAIYDKGGLELNFVTYDVPEFIVFSGIEADIGTDRIQKEDCELPKLKESRKLIKVKTVNINDVLSQWKQQEDIDHIDLFDIDIEGADLKVVKSLDFSLIKIRYLLVECSSDNEEEFKSYLAQKGFELCRKLGDDLLFVNENF